MLKNAIWVLQTSEKMTNHTSQVWQMWPKPTQKTEQAQLS